MAEIRIENLRKAFGGFVAVQGASLAIADGEFFVLLGPSGCGKTTTLRMIAGLELPSGGRILLDGEEVTFRRAAQRDIAFVFQMFALYPHLDVRRNIGFPLRCQGVPRAERRERVEAAAKMPLIPRHGRMPAREEPASLTRRLPVLISRAARRDRPADWRFSARVLRAFFCLEMALEHRASPHCGRTI